MGSKMTSSGRRFGSIKNWLAVLPPAPAKPLGKRPNYKGNRKQDSIPRVWQITEKRKYPGMEEAEYPVFIFGWENPGTGKMEPLGTFDEKEWPGVIPLIVKVFVERAKTKFPFKEGASHKECQRVVRKRARYFAEN